MKRLFLPIVFGVVLLTFSAWSQDKPFYPQRMITDLHGVVTNGQSVITYGDYGIIMYSLDKGSTWKQITIGDKYNVLKIINVNGVYYGATQYSLIRSVNNGKNWQNTEIDSDGKIDDLATDGSNLYVISNTGIYSYGLNHDFEPKAKLTDLDTAAKYSCLIYNSGSLFYIESDNYLKKFDLAQKSIENIDLTSFRGCDTCYNLWNLKADNGKIYLLMHGDSVFINTHNNIMMKSENNGEIWTKVFTNTIDCNTYNVINNEIYLISYGYSTKNYYFPFYQKADDSGNFTTINEYNPAIKRSYEPVNEYSLLTIFFNDFIQAGGDTLIAVGNDKIISVSVDNGKSWRLLSFANPYSRLNPSVLSTCLDDSLILMNGEGLSFETQLLYKSKDGGVLWLPQDSASVNYDWNSTFTYNISKSGEGFIIGNDVNNKNLILISNDTGSLFKAYETNFDVNLYSQCLNNFKFNNDYVFVTNNMSDVQIYMLSYPDTLATIVKLKDFNAFGAVKWANDELYMPGLILKNWITTDSGSYYKDWSYVILKSSDQGKHWDTLVKDLPIGISVVNKTKYQFTYTGCYLYSDWLILPIIASPLSFKKFYLYNLSTNKFDSTETNFNVSQSQSGQHFFTFQNALYVLSEKNDYLYKTTSINPTEVKWDSIPLGQIFDNWIPFNWQSPIVGASNIFSVTPNGNNLQVTIGKQEKGNLGIGLFKMNYVKLTPNNPVPVKDDFQIEGRDVFLTGLPAFPNPADKYARTVISWNSAYKIENAQISVYNLFGEKLPNIDLSVEPINAYSAYLTWNCLAYQSGLYFIHVTLAGESRSIPVFVVR